MRTYSLVFLDIDGTLLDSSHQVMPQTKRILNRLEERGVPIILCSARSPGGVETVERQAGLHGPIACYGGGLILDTERSILNDEGIGRETAAAFKRFALERFPELVVSAYLYDVWLVDDASDPGVQREARISRCTPLEGSLQAASENVPHVHKLLAMGPQQQITKLQNTAAELFPQLTLVRSGPIYLEVLPAEVSKRRAVEHLQAYYQVDRNETVAFGDSFVDLEMLQYAGLGVAMENAPRQVKEAADRTTASNDGEGIYLVLKGLRFSGRRP